MVRLGGPASEEMALLAASMDPILAYVPSTAMAVAAVHVTF